MCTTEIKGVNMRFCLSFLMLLICFNLSGSPVRLNNDSSEDYHPCWRPGTGNQQIGFTRRYDEYKEIEILSVDDTSHRITLDIDIPGDFAFCWSPDGTKLVFDARDDSQGNLWIYDFSDSSSTQLTHYNSVGAFHPSWSPDGSKIAFMRFDDIVLVDVDSGSVSTLLADNEENWHPSWSPNGDKIVFTSNRSGNPDLWMINSDGTGSPEQITDNPAHDDRGKYSPNGRYIAFASDRDGTTDVWLKDLNTGTERKIIYSNGYDSHPDWSDDGTRIAFASTRYGTFDIFYQNISEFLDIDNERLTRPETGLRNYPNPFNPSTTIELQLPEGEYCEVNVHNIREQKVKSIFEGFKQAGKHVFQWDGSDDFLRPSSSGTYLIVLKTDRYSQTVKSVLIK